MKAYEQVVKERYDGREVEIPLYENPYSLINPVGFYGSMRIREAFYNVFKGLRELGVDVSQEKILDVGCGKGDLTRYFADLFHNPERIYGLDLSAHRINQARTLNPRINYFVEDLVTFQTFKEEDFGLITATDVFMHLETEEQILRALKNIGGILKENGIFIWYDAVAKDHFVSENDAEFNGFHPKQMVEVCQRAGFNMLFSNQVFKNVMWKYHSAYLTQKFPMWLVSLAESILPGSPGNVIIAFQKAPHNYQ